MDNAIIRHGDGSQGAVQAAVEPIDAKVVRLWLHGRSAHTRRAYRAGHDRLQAFTGHKALADVTLDDLQRFADALRDDCGLSGASRALVLSSVKSLLGFAHRLGFLTFDVGRALRLPRHKDRLSERILDESQVHRMVALESDARNQAILHLLYSSGLRVSELVALKWRDVQARDGGEAQINVLGKREKTRVVLLSSKASAVLLALKGPEAQPDGPIFVSRKARGHLDPSMVLRIVRKAAQRAGISDKAVSPHFLRHSHATHAIDRGAPLHLVAGTLGHSNLATTGRYLHARPSDSSSRYLGM